MKSINNYSELEYIKTPILDYDFEYEDADEELSEIALYISKYTTHHNDINIDGIKFLYSKKSKKEGGRFVSGELIKRQVYEKIINDKYDFFISVYYDLWKELDIKNKVIQLDKIMCGIDTGSLDKPRLSKRSCDRREYHDNLMFFGASNVLESSEIVHLACQRIKDGGDENG